jgi:hypothetical protein
MPHSIKENLKKHIEKIGIAITLFIVVIILYFAFNEIKIAHDLVGFSDKNPYTQKIRRVRVKIRADQFNPTNVTFSGSSIISITPNISQNSDGNIIYPIGEPKNTKSLKNATLSFMHRSQEYGKPIIMIEGDSEAIELKPKFGGISGRGDFTWQAQTNTSSFWYPFDSYSLHVNPTLFISTKNETFEEFIETLEVEVGISNFRMNVISRQSINSTDDRGEIIFRRPIALRIVTGITGLLAVLWLFYLVKYADPGTYIGQIISFFLGILGIKTVLLSGFSVFPSILDYLFLMLSVMAIGIVLSKWIKESVFVSTTKCPFCKMKISIGASRCPYCTSNFP